MTFSTNKGQPRLRIFAGPNGSGKSTVIKSIRQTLANGRKIDFGVYINADDIAQCLSDDLFTFDLYVFQFIIVEFLGFAKNSGLVSGECSLEVLSQSVRFEGNLFKLSNKKFLDRIAQIVARFLREWLLAEKKRFSFETVFSHESNLDIMRRARDAGYKVYLYFVATESPEINKFRVALRVKQKGHNVPPELIESRYYRTLGLLYQAAELSYQAFFFDNSLEDTPYRLIGHFKMADGVKVWDPVRRSEITN